MECRYTSFLVATSVRFLPLRLLILLIIYCLLLQFHPESIATRYGRHIFQNFKRITTEYGSPSSSFLERKAHSAGKLEKSHVP